MTGGDVESQLTRAAEVIRAAPTVALACHVSPDGDALGSMLGLHHVLRAAGISSIASFSEPFVVAPHYRELPGLELLTPPDQYPMLWRQRASSSRAQLETSYHPRPAALSTSSATS